MHNSVTLLSLLIALKTFASFCIFCISLRTNKIIVHHINYLTDCSAVVRNDLLGFLASSRSADVPHYQSLLSLLSLLPTHRQVSFLTFLYSVILSPSLSSTIISLCLFFPLLISF